MCTIDTTKDKTVLLRAALLLERYASIIDAAQLDGRLKKGDAVRRDASKLRRISRTSANTREEHP